MSSLIELVKAAGDVPLPTLVALVLLTGFGLSAFAIYVVAKIAAARTNGSSQQAARLRMSGSIYYPSTE